MPPSPPIVLYLADTMAAISTDQLQRAMPALMAQAHVPGVSVAAVSDGQVTWRSAFGAVRAGSTEGVTPETLFQAASLSKPVFAYAVLKLADDGVLSLDDPLAGYVDGPFVEDDELLHQVTVRHVLSHTTGWPNWRPRSEALCREAPPGERFGYSGEGFVYLQRAVEHLTHQPVEAFMQARVLQPLGLRSSSFAWPDRASGVLAAGHDADGAPLEPRGAWSPNAAFSLHSTPTDMARFVAGVIAAPGDMLVPQVRVNKRVSWGLGWGLESSGEGRAFWHWGDNPGFKSFAIGLPDAGRGAVVMTNADGGRRLCAWVVERLLGTDHPALEWLARRYQLSS
jgi:CubicO group peptidase (beta-lactamase class C family)